MTIDTLHHPYQHKASHPRGFSILGVHLGSIHEPNTKPMTNMKTTTTEQCPECGAYCTISAADEWLECLNCSRISCDRDPPDSLVWESCHLPAADLEELAMELCSASLTEHAYEQVADPRHQNMNGFPVRRLRYQY
jgi:hypothetical protein